ncbi:MAG: hypothetical protein GY816_18065, partial [Cytophagales bacterium]|nr:hypothetical protein [Cytophagales bacterium]
MNKLNSTNPDHITYTHPPMDIAVLGGIRLEGLDRMRVTLKVQVEHLSIRHNLDLYNDTQTEKLIRKIAERLEIGTSVAAAALTDLTDELEKYRLEKIERIASSGNQKQTRMLSEQEIKKAKVYASAPNLMQRTGDDLQTTGIIGEWINAVVLGMAMTSRKCKDPLSVVTLAKSGMGKSYLQEKVAATMPQEDIIESTMITESSFYRFDRHELSGKIFLIEDLDGAEAVLYPIREMQSKKRISKTVTIKDTQGKLKTVTLVVEGPISVCGCTTKESLYEDNENRSLLLHLDGSKEQDEQIMSYHRAVAASQIDKSKEEEVREQLELVQRILTKINIVNPFAELIQLPPSVRNPRRTLPLLLSFIEVITHYHQHQREELADENGEVFIETIPEDIEWAFKLLRNVLFRKSDELSDACRKFYDYLRSLKLNKEGFTTSKIREHRSIHPRTLNRYLNELTEFGRIRIIGGNKHKGGYK